MTKITRVIDFLETEWEGEITKMHVELLKIVGILPILKVVIVLQFIYMITYQILHFKYMWFIIYQLDLRKAEINHVVF